MPTARSRAKLVASDPDARSPDRAAEAIDSDSKRLLAATLDLASLLRHHESFEPASSRLGIGQVIDKHGLGRRHISALLTVALYGPMSVTQLANRERVTLKTASLIAVELQTASMIERREDPTDRRRTIVAIDRRKKRMISTSLANRAAPLRRTLERLSPPQRKAFIGGLEVLAQEMARGRASG
jgi:DNA-binding MarR family transcriptional regulator